MNDKLNQLLLAWRQARLEADAAFREFRSAAPEKESDLLGRYIALDGVEARSIDSLVEEVAAIPLSDLPPNQLKDIMQELERSLSEEDNRRNRHH